MTINELKVKSYDILALINQKKSEIEQLNQMLQQNENELGKALQVPAVVGEAQGTQEPQKEVKEDKPKK